MLKVLLVEDNDDVAESVIYYLTKIGYEVLHCDNGNNALSYLNIEEIDLIILDLQLPDMCGFEIAKKVKETYDMPIIIVSANLDYKNKLRTLDLEVEDFIEKPAKLEELDIRIKMALKKKNNISINTNFEQKFYFDKTQKQFIKNGKILELSKTEYKLLFHLYSKANTNVSKEDICKELDFNPQGNYLIRTISSLRKKIEDDYANPVYLKTIYGGYVYLNLM